MNWTETEFKKMLDSKGLKYISQPKPLNIMNFTYTSPLTMMEENVKLDQVPDFIVLDEKNEIVIMVEIKHGFIHQDFPFREKLIKQFIQQGGNNTSSILTWAQSHFDDKYGKNDNKINLISYLTLPSGKQVYTTGWDIDYLVLQPNNLKGDTNSAIKELFGDGWIDFYEHQQLALKREHSFKRNVREFLMTTRMLMKASLLDNETFKNALLLFMLVFEKHTGKLPNVLALARETISKENINITIGLINNLVIVNQEVINSLVNTQEKELKINELKNLIKKDLKGMSSLEVLETKESRRIDEAFEWQEYEYKQHEEDNLLAVAILKPWFDYRLQPWKLKRSAEYAFAKEELENLTKFLNRFTKK